MTERVSAGTRIYYVDALTDKKNQPYISLSEVPTDRNPGKKERQRIFIHTEDIDKVIEALTKVADHIKNDTAG